MSTLLAMTLVAAAASTTPLSELERNVAAARNLTAVDAAVGVVDASVQVGQLTVTLHDAVVFPVLDGTGVRVGSFVQGAGRFTVRAQDRTATEALAASARNRWLLDWEKGAVSGTFRELLIFETGTLFGELWSGKSARLGVAVDRKAFESAFTTLDRLMLAWPQRLAENRLDPTSGRFAAVVFGGDARLAWTHDASRGFREDLFYAFGLPGGAFVRRLIVSQPIGGGSAAQSPSLSVKRMAVNLVQETTTTGFATTTVDLAVEREGARLARFALLSPETLERLDRLTASNRDIVRVLKVTDGQGRALSYHHGGAYSAYDLSGPSVTRGFPEGRGDLLVDLGPGRTAGETVRVVVGSSRSRVCCFATNVRNGSFGLLQGGVAFPAPANAAPWRPIDVEVEATLLEPYRMIFGGMPDPASVADGTRTFVGRARVTPDDLSVAVVRDVRAREATPGGVRLALIAPNSTFAAASDRALASAASYASYLTERLGPYPGGDLLVVAGVPAGGAAYVSLDGLETRKSCPVEESRDASSLATAIAFQWLDARSQPVDERAGVVRRILARYLGEAAIDATRPAHVASCLGRRVKDWQVATDECRWSGPVEAGGEVYIEQYPECLVGRRGLLGLDELRRALGDDAFFGAVRRMLDAAGDRPSGLDDLILAAGSETAAGAILDAAFRTYADRSTGPR